MSLEVYFASLARRVATAIQLGPTHADGKPADIQAWANGPYRLAGPHAVNADFFAVLIGNNSVQPNFPNPKIPNQPPGLHHQIHINCYEGVLTAALEAHCAHSHTIDKRCWLKHDLLCRYDRALMVDFRLRLDEWFAPFLVATEMQRTNMSGEAFGEYISQLGNHPANVLPAGTVMWLWEDKPNFATPLPAHCCLVDSFPAENFANRFTRQLIGDGFEGQDVHSGPLLFCHLFASKSAGYRQVKLVDLLKLFHSIGKADARWTHSRWSVKFYNLESSETGRICSEKIKAMNLDFEKSVHASSESESRKKIILESQNMRNLWVEERLEKEREIARNEGLRTYPAKYYLRKNSTTTYEDRRNGLLGLKAKFLQAANKVRLSK